MRCACRRYLPRRHGLWKLFWFDSPIAPRLAWRKTIASHLAWNQSYYVLTKKIWPPETSKVLNWLWERENKAHHNWRLLLNRKVSLLLWNSNTGKKPRIYAQCLKITQKVSFQNIASEFNFFLISCHFVLICQSSPFSTSDFYQNVVKWDIFGDFQTLYVKGYITRAI